MSADVTVDLIINQKASFQATFIVKDGGTVVDLTNYTVVAKYKQTFQIPDSQATVMSATITNAIAGEITISLTPQQTAVLQQGKYVYDVAITDNSGFKIRIVEGVMRVSPGVA